MPLRPCKNPSPAAAAPSFIPSPFFNNFIFPVAPDTHVSTPASHPAAAAAAASPHRGTKDASSLHFILGIIFS